MKHYSGEPQKAKFYWEVDNPIHSYTNMSSYDTHQQAKLSGVVYVKNKIKDGIIPKRARVVINIRECYNIDDALKDSTVIAQYMYENSNIRKLTTTAGQTMWMNYHKPCVIRDEIGPGVYLMHAVGERYIIGSEGKGYKVIGG